MEQATDTSDNMYALSDEELLELDASQLSKQEVTETEQTTETEDTPIAVEEESTVVTETTPETEVHTGAELETTEETSTEQTQESEVDYKSFYEAVTKPFTANGKETQVKDPDDMIRLMQQGAGYHKKMAAIKPIAKVGKLLEDHGLMDETKLSYLIDLHNKKPEAIAALIKESGIDLYEFDVSTGDSYKPPSRQVEDSTLELQSVLDDLKQNSTTFEKTIEIVGNRWDNASRQILGEHPELIRIIDSQVQDGTYDKINQVIEYERMMGRLVGVSDIHAYKEIGERLFDNAQQEQPQQQETPVTPPAPTTNTVTTPVVPPVSSQNTEQRKKAAAAPRQGSAETKQIVNALALSDEDFMKLMSKQI